MTWAGLDLKSLNVRSFMRTMGKTMQMK